MGSNLADFVRCLYLSPAKAGFGSFGERDPRVTLAALAHPRLLSVAAPRLVAATNQIESWAFSGFSQNGEDGIIDYDQVVSVY